MPNPWRLRLVSLAWMAALLAAPDARAQLALPGAVAPQAEGAVAPEAGGSNGAPVRKKHKASGEAGPAIAPKLPSDDAILGKPLYLDGSRSVAQFERVGGETRLARLTLTGDRISRSGESCRVDVAGTPLKLTLRDTEGGLRRYDADFPACPFSFDVLDGAILVSKEHGACELKAADCRADPSGLWGQGENDFDPKRAGEMLNLRARIEKNVRANFRALYDRYAKDKPVRGALVREQAGFSARREEICRAYAREEDFGYCSLRVTEARALTLAAQLAHAGKAGAKIAGKTDAAARKTEGKAAR